MRDEVQIIVPGRDDDAVSNSLRRLTKKIHDAGLADASGFGIGGEFGYGVGFENDVFMMHPFCWCERGDCPWCGGRCGCKERRCGYFLDGAEITKRAYEVWHKTIVKPLPWEAVPRDREYVSPPNWWSGEPVPAKTPEYESAQRAFDNYIEERDRRSGRIFRAHVHKCGKAMYYDQPEDVWATYAPQPYPEAAPHFWHKPSGTRAWWYKWIGRDMIVDVKAEWHDVARECSASVIRGRSDDSPSRAGGPEPDRAGCDALRRGDGGDYAADEAARLVR